jgi:hypothetical protein
MERDHLLAHEVRRVSIVVLANVLLNLFSRRGMPDHGELPGVLNPTVSITSVESSPARTAFAPI